MGTFLGKVIKSTGLTDFLSSFVFKKETQVLFLGLDNAGKTTLLHKLRDNTVNIHEPTRHAQQQDLIIGNLAVRATDMGGHAAARRLWRDYFVKVDAIVFLVDASNSTRFEESRAELNSLFLDEQLQDVPFVILGNKIDAPGAVSEPELRRELGVTMTTGKPAPRTNGVRPVEIFMCSVVLGNGYMEALNWMKDQIQAGSD